MRERELAGIRDFLSSLAEMDKTETQLTLRNLELGMRRIGEGLEEIEARELPEGIEELRFGLRQIARGKDELKRLGQWHKSNFNVFKVLECQYDERAHSGVLAWLLDPEESHGLRSMFLERFMMGVFRKRVPCLAHISVRREARDTTGIPDVVVDAQTFRLVIENKIGSEEGIKEGVPQTKRYATPYEMAGGIGRRFFLVFVTPGGREPASTSFRPVSYDLISRLLQELLPSCGEEVRILVRHFVEHLRYDIRHIS